jgi:hypothetical protein
MVAQRAATPMTEMMSQFVTSGQMDPAEVVTWLVEPPRQRPRPRTTCTPESSGTWPLESVTVSGAPQPVQERRIPIALPVE